MAIVGDRKQRRRLFYRVLLGGGQEDSSGAVLAWDLFQQDIPCPWMHLAHTICLVAFIPKPILMVSHCSYSLALSSQNLDSSLQMQCIFEHHLLTIQTK